jgi:arylsulfatase A-like enzyme
MGAGPLLAQTAEQRLSLPIQPPPFTGTIAPSVADSKPDWLPLVRAPTHAPNVLLVMTDDVGFAASSTFGGPVPTPNLDRLAQRGLRYNAFNTTGICSPSRAALLTGRNHHTVGMGTLVDMPGGYPGYSGKIPDSAATVARVLTLNGYNTAMFGKHHNTPSWEASQAGPFDHWPTGLGFQYFYGFMGGDADQYKPVLYRGVTRVESQPGEEAGLLDKRLADDAIRWIHNQKAAAQDTPFFVYMAPGTAHAPHQAPPEWIARFHGAFDQGWDRLREETFTRQRKLGIIPANAKLTPRPAEIQGWDSLSPAARKVYARMMEVYAGMLAFQDAQIGRVLAELDRMGEADNTLVIFVQGDNGGSAEAGNEGMLNEIGRIINGVKDDVPWLMANIDLMGSNRTYENYPAGWAWATNTPFQWTKQVSSHLGGVRNGLVISWPQGIRPQGQIRSQYSHLIDIMPTILDAAGLPAPTTVNGIAQQPIDGISLRPTFRADTQVPRTQYYEQTGNRAIYQDGWLANTYPIRMPWEDRPTDPNATYHWELYNLRADYSQSNNLSAKYPAKLKEMQAAFDATARASNVYPIDDRFASLRIRDVALARPVTRRRWTFWGSDTSVMQGTAPSLAGRSFTISADVTVPGENANGVLVANGSWFGGWAFFLKDGKPTAIHAVSRRPEEIFQITGNSPISPGPHRIGFVFTSDGGMRAGGTMQLMIDGILVGEGRIGRTILMPAGLGETLDIGRDTGVPVTEIYGPSNLPADAISKVDIDVQ